MIENKRLILTIPNKISICFVGGDKKRTDEQQEMLLPLLSKYDVNFCRRCDSFSGLYLSFSQVINELVVEAKEEFLFFLNPKAICTPEIIEEMLIDLCSGFCWTSKAAFELWGTTKELFRQIGLMDERFNGGDFEDWDFICRIKLFKKAIKFQHDANLYERRNSPLNDMRGASFTFFKEKWVWVDDILYLNDKFSEVKKIKDYKNRIDISDSWMDDSQSLIIDKTRLCCSEGYYHNIKIGKFKEEFIFCDSNILINCNSENRKIEFLCQYHTEISVQIMNSNSELISPACVVSSNIWNGDTIFDNITENIEVKIFHEGNKIYHNKNLSLPLDLNIPIGLKITKKELI